MISSPCKKCSRENLAKDECLKDCQVLQAVQNIQRSIEQNCVSSGIDRSEECEYSLSPPPVTDSFF